MQDADPVEIGPIRWPDPAPVKKDIETPTENQHSSLFIIVKLYVEVRNHVIQYIFTLSTVHSKIRRRFFIRDSNKAFNEIIYK